MDTVLAVTKIYISIASYRDPLLESTIIDLFKKAKNPNNIFVGCFIQAYKNDIDCRLSKKYNNVFIDYEVPGKIFSVTKCRNKALQWLDDTYDFVLQIDSHTRFKQDWDENLINMWKSAKDNKALLSTTTSSWIPSEGGDLLEDFDGVVVFQEFNNNYSKNIFLKDKELIPESKSIATDIVLHKGWYLSAHFIFGPSDFFILNKQDEEIAFWGEEFINSINAFNNDWNIYVPSIKYVYHMFPQNVDESKLNKIWKDFPSVWEYKNNVSTSGIVDKIVNGLFISKEKENLFNSLRGYNISETILKWYNEIGDKND